jgi:AcrR family transcriptional regulator
MRSIDGGGMAVVGTGMRAQAPRARRSGEAVRGLIVQAARGVFAERGFAGATTREIATRAGASEVLIFRYFGTKAGLFEEVVLAPFNKLIGDFVEQHRDDLPDRLGGNAEFVRSFYPFLKANADLLQAMVKSSARQGGEGGLVHGLDDYFRRAAERMRLQYQREGVESEISPDLCVRFAFGTLAAAILFADWFFPEGDVPDAAVTHALSRMLYKAMTPLPEPIR